MDEGIYFADVKLEPKYDSVCNAVYSELAGSLGVYNRFQKGRVSNDTTRLIERVGTSFFALEMVEETIEKVYQSKLRYEKQNPLEKITQDEYNPEIVEKVVIDMLTNNYRAMKELTSDLDRNHPANQFVDYLEGFLAIDQLEE